jgi:hypothetical protein
VLIRAETRPKGCRQTELKTHLPNSNSTARLIYGGRLESAPAKAAEWGDRAPWSPERAREIGTIAGNLRAAQLDRDRDCLLAAARTDLLISDQFRIGLFVRLSAQHETTLTSNRKQLETGVSQ